MFKGEKLLGPKVFLPGALVSLVAFLVVAGVGLVALTIGITKAWRTADVYRWLTLGGWSSSLGFGGVVVTVIGFFVEGFKNFA